MDGLRVRSLLELLDLDAGGLVTANYRSDYKKPRAPGGFGTKLRRNFIGEPDPYIRHRPIPGTGRNLVQFVAYTRGKSSSDLLRAIKAQADTKTVQHLVRRAAIYLAHAIAAYYSPDAVMPAPSSSPIASTFAAELAARLGQIPVVKPPSKVAQATKIGVLQRMAKAKNNFYVADQPRLNGIILVVDDYTTTGATMVGIAAGLLELPDVEDVIGVALAAP